MKQSIKQLNATATAQLNLLSGIALLKFSPDPLGKNSVRGKSFDLDKRAGMVNPLTDPYVITLVAGDYHIYVRSEKGYEMTLDAVRYKGNNVSVSGKFYSLTNTLMGVGFNPLPRKDPYYSSRRQSSNKGYGWNHFRYELDDSPVEDV